MAWEVRMRKIERNGENKLEWKLLTPASQDNGIKMDIVACDSNVSVNELNDVLQKIPELDFKWKMSFSPDLNKQAQEVIFSWKFIKQTTLSNNRFK